MKESNMMKFVTSFIYILFGLALMLWPQTVENIICTMLAVCVIVFGVLKLIGYSVTKVESRIMDDTNGFAAGISLVIFGIFLWFKGTIVIALIPFILGFMITYKGLEGIQNVINFILTAFCMFLVIRAMNKIHRKPEAAPAKPKRICPFCKGEIADDATRCPHCTSMLE